MTQAVIAAHDLIVGQRHTSAQEVRNWTGQEGDSRTIGDFIYPASSRFRNMGV